MPLILTLSARTAITIKTGGLLGILIFTNNPCKWITSDQWISPTEFLLCLKLYGVYIYRKIRAMKCIVLYLLFRKSRYPNTSSPLYQAIKAKVDGLPTHKIFSECMIFTWLDKCFSLFTHRYIICFIPIRRFFYFKCVRKKYAPQKWCKQIIKVTSEDEKGFNLEIYIE